MIRMFVQDLSADSAAVLARLDTVLDELTALPLDSYTDGQVLGLWRDLETRLRRLAVTDHAVISQVQSRRLTSSTGHRTEAALARDVLRCSAGQARLRVQAAEALGPRRSLTGEALEPIYAITAAAQATGEVSVEAARLIVRTVERLPDSVQAEKGLEVEAFLVEQARMFDLDSLRLLAHRLTATLDPDGILKDEAYRQTRRYLDLHTRPDGSARIEGELTVEAAETLRTVLDPLAAPREAVDGQQDPRTPGQRRHDGLLTALRLTLRAGLLPASHGLTTTVIVTISEQSLVTGEGTAVTGHGAIISANKARSWLTSSTRLIPVRLTPTGGIATFGRSRRLFTETQRLAMIARDHGCSFPGCDAPPQQCDAHHVEPWDNGGPTDITNGALLCDHHHDHFQQLGWTCQMINNLPNWVPPPWLDPEQKPIKNTAHNPVPV